MEAPNHIYLDSDELKNIQDPEYASFIVWNYKPLNPIKYIREQAIIDMLEDAIKNLSDGSLAGYYESMAYQDIIEKIKEL